MDTHCILVGHMKPPSRGETAVYFIGYTMDTLWIHVVGYVVVRYTESVNTCSDTLWIRLR